MLHGFLLEMYPPFLLAVLNDLGVDFSLLALRSKSTIIVDTRAVEVCVWRSSRHEMKPFFSDQWLVFVPLPDLKAFERRLTEYVSCLQPATGRWRSRYQLWWSSVEQETGLTSSVLFCPFSDSDRRVGLYSHWSLELVNRSRYTEGQVHILQVVTVLRIVFLISY